MRLIRPGLTFILACLFAIAAHAQSVTYDVSFPNNVHHEAEITVTFTDIPSSSPLEVLMSRSSPGRYALHEFAKNVYNVRATDADGHPLSITRPGPSEWDVSGHNGTVLVTYTLFADYADGTYSGIDNTHAHLNMPATFMWVRGMETAPIRITFHRPDPAWGIATQLLTTGDPETFTAPTLDYFMDSPTEISPFTLRTWDVTSNGKTYTMRLALHHDGTEKEADDYAAMIRKVVPEEIAVYGETPDYEPGTYTFIADYLPYVHGDGMEHRNSTILVSTLPLATDALRNLGTVAHEFFHQWNVERIRPRSIEPFDFEKANMSGELWFAEGFTSYYTGLLMRRAGITDDDAYAAYLTRSLNVVLTAPGRHFFSAVEMSMQAPFVDRASAIDRQNKQNTFISYYTWGQVIGLGLDLTLRTRFPGLTLDDYMRAMWRKHGKTEIPYTLDDLKNVLGAVTGDRDFADDFFRRYIEGHDVVDYEALLSRAGYMLQKANAGHVWLGAPVTDDDDGARIDAGPILGSPFYSAGLDRDDIITQIGDVTIEGAAYVEALRAVLKPGDTAPIRFIQRGVEKEATLTLTEDPAMEVVSFEAAGWEVTPAIQALRDAWLGAHAAGHGSE